MRGRCVALVVCALVSSATSASASEPARPAYRLRAEYDVPVLGIGFAFVAARMIRAQQPHVAYCAPRCDPAELNAFDRSTAGLWNPSWGIASNLGATAIGAAPVAYLLLDEEPLDALNDLVVIGESAAMAAAMSTLVSVTAARPRPFLYGDKAPNTERESTDASMSFISSHTSIAFAISTSTWLTYRRLHPGSATQWAVLGVGDAAATFVGVARVIAGRHFPTDVITAAVLGTSIGILVPAFHEAPVKVVPTATAGGGGLAVAGAF